MRSIYPCFHSLLLFVAGLLVLRALDQQSLKRVLDRVCITLSTSVATLSLTHFSEALPTSVATISDTASHETSVGACAVMVLL